MPLTDTAIRTTKPREKQFKLSDEKGLFLLVHPNGGKYWRLKYRTLGKEKTLAIGVYPAVGLKEAREARDQARKQLADGVDPSKAKQSEKQSTLQASANSFETVALLWFKEHASTVTDTTNRHTQSWLTNDVFPWLGDRPISEITAPEILTLLKRVDDRGTRYSAHKIRSRISMVFRYGIRNGLCSTDPTRDLVGAIPSASTTHFAAITEPLKVGEMLRAFEAFSGTFHVQCALKLAPLLFVRPGELRTAEWKDIDLERAEWRFLVTKTKTNHLVPLSTQAVAILRELQPLTGNGRYVFPGARTYERPMSDAAVNAALRRLGFDTQTEITGHGFRAMARTILHEELGQKPEVIEHQLAHAVPDVLGAAYNRTKFIKERRAMMQIWADYLDALRIGGNVIPLAKRS